MGRLRQEQKQKQSQPRHYRQRRSHSTPLSPRLLQHQFLRSNSERCLIRSPGSELGADAGPVISAPTFSTPFFKGVPVEHRILTLMSLAQGQPYCVDYWKPCCPWPWFAGFESQIMEPIGPLCYFLTSANNVYIASLVNNNIMVHQNVQQNSVVWPLSCNFVVVF